MTASHQGAPGRGRRGGPSRDSQWGGQERFLYEVGRRVLIGSILRSVATAGCVLGLAGCPSTLVDDALSGRDDDGVGDTSAPVGAPERGLIRVPRRARLFSPLAWWRDAVALTETCVLVRGAR
ncbi:hypothetical protein [Actinomyces wuliandei]|uniref:hypothetical protein n=1 Tax=Actinomyces wuliandei TaxID=2057743 RepID=UPI001FA989EF|nr:hypothetical protein [Actinomyces wuliandei]